MIKNTFLMLCLAVMASVSVHADELSIKISSVKETMQLQEPLHWVDQKNARFAIQTNFPKLPFSSGGILADDKFQTAVQALEARSGSETLAEPVVTVESGRQIQMMEGYACMNEISARTALAR